MFYLAVNNKMGKLAKKCIQKLINFIKTNISEKNCNYHKK